MNDNNYIKEQQNNIQPEFYEEPISIKEWIITLLIMVIPIVNIIMIFIWAFGSKTKKSKSNYFKASLIFAGIATVFSIVLVIFIVSFIDPGIEETLQTDFQNYLEDTNYNNEDSYDYDYGQNEEEFEEAISKVKLTKFVADMTYEEVINGYLKTVDWNTFNLDTNTIVVEIKGVSIEDEEICIQFLGEFGIGFSNISEQDFTLEYFEADGESLDPIAAMEYIYEYLNN